MIAWDYYSHPPQSRVDSASVRDNDRILIGAMSGTSADGVDAVAVGITGTPPHVSVRVLAHERLAYEPDLRAEIFHARANPCSISALARLGRRITLAHAQAINQVMARGALSPQQIAAVAAHGQTLFHDPPDTVQWLDAPLLAQRTRCRVISDFRRADCAAGGQGAPLVPFADYLLFRDPRCHRILLNLGGIANLTSIPPDAAMEQVMAFDTGPGNCVSDWLIRTHLPDAGGYDRDGELAMRGHADEYLAMASIAGYLEKNPPKSTDVDSMIAAFSTAMNSTGAAPSLNDLLASACRATAAAIAGSLDRFVPDCSGPATQLLISGGGVNNARMIGELRAAIGTRASVRRLDELGIAADAKEAVAFALLGVAALDGVPGNLPRITGAQRAVILGSITPRPC